LPGRAAGKLCSTVTAGLGGRIVGGEFAPGAVLPTEAELCALFRVSRTTVREAIKRLHGKGLVAGRPRNGTRVLPTDQWNQFDSELLSWRIARGMEAEILDQLYEIRDCFEPRACHLAAIVGSAGAKAAVAEQFARIVNPSLALDDRVAADLDFHLAIFAATGNLFMVSLGAAIRTALHMSFSLSQRRDSMPQREQALHGDVCAAIVSGDGDAAEASMRRLLAASRRTLRKVLKASERQTQG
jgi:DNA-binding FadR family transcriptional regulator